MLFSTISTIVLRKIKTRHTLKKALVVIPVLGTGHATKSDDFLERFQTAVDPHPPPLRMVLTFSKEYIFMKG